MAEVSSFLLITSHSRLLFLKFLILAPSAAHFAAISEYTTDIHHIAGKQNFVADTLSRPTITFPQTPQINLNYQNMSADQVVSEVQPYRTAITNLRLQHISIGNVNVSLLCDISTGRPRPIVSISWRKRVFDAIHYFRPKVHFLTMLLHLSTVRHPSSRHHSLSPTSR